LNMIGMFTFIVLILSIIIHEVAHGSVAYSLGDPTAKYAGRLSLNPLKHIDPLGSVILPLIVYWQTGFFFGWAKPVPINPYNFKDQRWGELKVAIAGPATNILIGIVFGLFLRFIPLSQNIASLFLNISYINLFLGFFNLIPVPPLDGSHVLFSLLSHRFSNLRRNLERYQIFFLVLAVLLFIKVGVYFVQVLVLIIAGLPIS